MTFTESQIIFFEDDSTNVKNMGNCCIKLFSLFRKREHKRENEPLLVSDPLLVSADNIVTGQRHTISPQLVAETSDCQGKSTPLSFRFGTPIMLESSDVVESEKHITKPSVNESYEDIRSNSPEIARKEQSDEEGYGSSFEAVASGSKGIRVSTESRDENILFDQTAKENYEAEVQVALASIQDAERSKKKEDESENVNADVDYYSI